MSDVAIRAEGLAKSYRIVQGQAHRSSETLREALMRGLRNIGRSRNVVESDLFWALDDISFDVRPGEVMGIIGHNGAGKSTLLKILSRITEPTRGRAEVFGRMGSLLEVGTGFHAELTGRENIYLNGAILGMRKADIDRKFDEIVAFAEVEQFLDTPVKRYSSGMYVRLAFSVAAHLDPEILVIDEVLSVGDAAFQRKSIGAMEKAARGGRTVLFVSHNLKAVKTLCTRAMMLQAGRVLTEGTPDDVIAAYDADLRDKVAHGGTTMQFPMRTDSLGQITQIRITDVRGNETLRHTVIEPVRVEVDFTLQRDFPTLMLNLHVWTADGLLVFASMDSDHGNFTSPEPLDVFPRSAGSYRASIIIPAPLLNAGLYELEFMLTPGPVRLDTQRGVYIQISDGGSFLSHVTKSDRGGLIAAAIPWSVERVGDPISAAAIR